MALTKKGQNPIKHTKGRNANSLKAREVFKIIGKTVDLPHERVQDVFQAWYEIVDYCLEKNIDIPILNIGVLTTSLKIGRKKGDKVKMPKGFRYTDENGVLQVAKEAFEKTLEEDRGNYYMPRLKFYKSFKEKLKEDTKFYGENKQD